MELPFAVEPEEFPRDSDEGSLVTASSQDEDNSILRSYSEMRNPVSSYASSFLPSRVATAMSQWTSHATQRVGSAKQPHPQPLETNDYTYVNVWETDEVEIVVPDSQAGMDPTEPKSPIDILTVLLNPTASTTLTGFITQANQEVDAANLAKKGGDLAKAVQYQTRAAELYYAAATHCRQEGYVSLMNSMFLLSQIQAKAAVALQQVVKLPANGLRDRVRGALEEQASPDLSESTFLGRAKSPGKETIPIPPLMSHHLHADASSRATMNITNPVDDMLALERELSDMEMTLELGNSIASLDARKNSSHKMDGSFMVVRSARATPRARANRVQPTRAKPPQQLEPDSSQMLNSSVASLAASVVMLPNSQSPSQPSQQPEHTKQLMRLMESVKILGDENAALLKRVEGAENAQSEAKIAQKAMEHFKTDYAAKFQSLKDALKRFQKDYPSLDNPVTNSEFTTDHRQQDQLVRKLTADLKKEKEESRRKDAALKKYETFYKEVKARSAQKQAQRRNQQNQAASRSKG